MYAVEVPAICVALDGIHREPEYSALAEGEGGCEGGNKKQTKLSGAKE